MEVPAAKSFGSSGKVAVTQSPPLSQALKTRETCWGTHTRNRDLPALGKVPGSHFQFPVVGTLELSPPFPTLPTQLSRGHHFIIILASPLSGASPAVTGSLRAL